ncbi:uncharacterized protein LOC104444099 isoform X1 [Eucalyptus grandis]|uniref:uncharacterized protein LOC104444099 isoform X1 n=1 Tax=Eucalyptus grandis TaxID=71139 RepID=UPI00192F08BD|nr:uncharacterized protein LOC104444099 isoform X1 [Eucalyptus grandis]
MCRSTDFPHLRPSPAGDRLDLKAFYVRFSAHRPAPEPEPGPGPFPDSLTLLYLPGAAGRPLEIDGAKVRPDHPAFLTLHRVVAPSRGGGGDVVYGSRDRVRAAPGLRFEVYLGGEKALRGSFRRDEERDWRLECACALEREVLAGAGWVSEVCAAAEGGRVAMSERVEMVARKRRGRKGGRGFYGLEEIPEESETESESDGDMGGGGACCCCGDGEGECGSDGRDDDDMEWPDGEDWEVNTEGVRWAVDVGIWVACLGVGYLVSKASAKSLRRRRFL